MFYGYLLFETNPVVCRAKLSEAFFLLCIFVAVCSLFWANFCFVRIRSNSLVCFDQKLHCESYDCESCDVVCFGPKIKPKNNTYFTSVIPTAVLIEIL